MKPLATTEEADFDALFDINVKGNFFTLQKALPLLNEETLESWSAGIPLGRVGLSTDIAQAVAFLASDASSYITGDNLIVSGGMGVGA